MNRRFKIIYYFLVVAMIAIFSYQVYLLFDVLLPKKAAKEYIAEEE